MTKTMVEKKTSGMTGNKISKNDWQTCQYRISQKSTCKQNIKSEVKTLGNWKTSQNWFSVVHPSVSDFSFVTFVTTTHNTPEGVNLWRSAKR
jgi:hypothetical protein